MLSVRDWGEGIPDEHKESIFARFERIVELHGGKIRIEDNPGGGSVFLVSVGKVAGSTAGPDGGAA